MLAPSVRSSTATVLLSASSAPSDEPGGDVWHGSRTASPESALDGRPSVSSHQSVEVVLTAPPAVTLAPKDSVHGW